jgi:hypothetical protein
MVEPLKTMMAPGEFNRKDIAAPNVIQRNTKRTEQPVQKKGHSSAPYPEEDFTSTAKPVLGLIWLMCW